MNRRFARRWPSLGFGVLVASYGLLAAFLAWGFSTPELDRVWRILQPTGESGFTRLGPSQLQTLSAALRRHPKLAGALTERSPVGFVEPSPGGCTRMPVSHLVLQPAPGQSLRIDVVSRGDSGAFPLTVSLGGAGVARALHFDAPGRQDFVLPRGRPQAPALLTLTLFAAHAPTAPQRSVQVCIDGQAVATEKTSP
jgi:hypothetical protein